MDATFIFQTSEHISAVDERFALTETTLKRENERRIDRVFVRTDIGLIVFDDFERPFSEARVVRVHLEEFFGEQHRFLSTDACSDFQFGIVLIGWFVWQDLI